MKKLFFLLFVFITIKGFAQYPVKQRIGGDSTEVWGTMFWGKKGLVNGVYLDTASANLSRISQYPYAQIAVGDTIWYRNSTATGWIKFGSGAAGGPTIIYVKDDLTVDTITNPGFQTLGRLHSDGLESGGILTSAGCMDIQITSASYYLNNGTHYISPATVLTVSAADPADPRKDLVVVDTFGVVSIITGTPSPIPNRPYYNTASQLVINEITVPAGATCLAINTIVIYDETGGTEYTPSTTGTITANPNNLDNPQHLLNADFVSVYADGSKLIFTKPSGQDTVFNNSVFKWFLYLNGRFFNQIQMQLFLSGVPVTSNISVNPYFNILDSNQYQPVAVPAYAFSAGGDIIFDQIVFTLAGDDLSGAKGFYLDYLQLQTGIQNTTSGKGVIFYGKNAAGDSTILLREDGVRFAAKDSSGGAGTAPNLQQVLDVGDVASGRNILLFTDNPQTTNSFISSINAETGEFIALVESTTDIPTGQAKPALEFLIYDSAFAGVSDHYLRADRLTGGGALHGKTWQLPNDSGTIALSVNGNRADVNGNITLPVGGSGTVTSVTATAPISITGTPTVNPNVVADTSKSIGRLATFSDVALKNNISDTAAMLSTYLRSIDTTNKWVNNISKNAAHDSIIYFIGSTRYAVRDSIGASSLPTIANLKYPGNVTGSTAAFNASSLNYSVYNVKDFGLVDDSVTDNLTAMRALLVLVPDGAAIYFPGGGKGYLFSDSLLINKSLMIYGDGMSSAYINYGGFTNTPQKGASNLFVNSSTANLFCLHTSATNKDPVITLHDLSLINTATSAPTAGGAIVVNDNIGHSTFYNFTVRRFYYGVNVVSGNNLRIHDFFIVGCVQDAIVLANPNSPDYGGFFIYNGSIFSGIVNTTTARGIYIKGGGGINISNIFFNAQEPSVFAHQMTKHIYSDFSNGQTAELHISQCHFNNFQNIGVDLQNVSAGPISIMQITDCHFNGIDTGYAINVNTFNNFTINNISAIGGSSTKAVINLTSCTNGNIGLVTYTGYTGGKYTLTSSSTIYNAYKSMATATDFKDGNLYVIGTALSGAAPTSNFFSVIGTLPTTTTQPAIGANLDITGAGSSASTQSAMRVQLEANYTGAGITHGITATNWSAGTGNSISYPGTFVGNVGTLSASRGAAATASNIGAWNWATGTLKNIGSLNDATLSQTNSATAISGGVIGMAKRVHASAIQFGGYFGLQQTQPTFVSAALVANNSAETVPIQIWQDAGTEVGRIDDGGALLLNTTTANSTLTVNGSVAKAYRAISALRTLDGTDNTIECTSGTFTVTLPTAVGIQGREYWITNTGSGTITIGTTSSQTFINVTATPTTLTVAQFTNYKVVSNNANWLAYKIVN